MRNRVTQLVECKSCKVSYQKRADNLMGWSGFCRVCSNNKKALTRVGTRKSTIRYCEECRLEIYQYNTTDKCKVCWLKFAVGENGVNYKKDRTTLAKKQERNDSSYQDWRMKVWKRDSFMCKLLSSDCLGRIEAHHIYIWSENPELRYEVDNGITLCHFHHPRKRFLEVLFRPLFRILLLNTPLN